MSEGADRCGFKLPRWRISIADPQWGDVPLVPRKRPAPSAPDDLDDDWPLQRTRRCLSNVGALLTEPAIPDLKKPTLSQGNRDRCESNPGDRRHRRDLTRQLPTAVDRACLTAAPLIAFRPRSLSEKSVFIGREAIFRGEGSY